MKGHAGKATHAWPLRVEVADPRSSPADGARAVAEVRDRSRENQGRLLIAKSGPPH